MDAIIKELLKSILELTQLCNNVHKRLIMQSEKIEELERRIETLEYHHTYHGDEE